MATTYNLGVHQESKTYLTDAAITTKNLLYKQGSDADHVAVSDASSIPLGTINDLCAAAEAELTVLSLGKGPTKIMVASEVIAAGAVVYAAASGKVAGSGTYPLGIAVTSSSGDGGEFEVLDILVAPASGMLATLYTGAGSTNNKVLYASTANTPAALSVTASTLVGRSSTGNLAALSASQVHTVLGSTHKVIAAGTYSWSNGTTTAATIAASAILDTDFVVCTLREAASTETLKTAIANNAVGIDVVLSANATNTTTKIDYIAVRAI